jgi:RNA polymerase sigma-70 factor (ECF subfamily)
VNIYHKKNRDQAKESIDNLAEWQIGDAESLTSTTSRSAEALAIANMPADIVKEALKDLKDEFREVVLQAIVMDLSYAEIAENMGTPVGTVMSRLHRGKKELREKLAGYAAEQGIGTDPANSKSKVQSKAKLEPQK